MVGKSPDPSSPYRLGTDTGTAPMCDTYLYCITADSTSDPQVKDAAKDRAELREENMAHERQLWKERRKEFRKLSKIR